MTGTPPQDGQGRMWRLVNLLTGAALLTLCLAGWASAALTPDDPARSTDLSIHPGPNEYGPNPNEVPQ
ncbi:hypothetical protein [Mameliella sp.]|uniref:hypothetical protein n=1 Tax=Mameliella sp. TaxID=1924940 RepID=UPI003B50DD47